MDNRQHAHKDTMKHNGEEGRWGGSSGVSVDMVMVGGEGERGVLLHYTSIKNDKLGARWGGQGTHGKNRRGE